MSTKIIEEPIIKHVNIPTHYLDIIGRKMDEKCSIAFAFKLRSTESVELKHELERVFKEIRRKTASRRRFLRLC